MQASYIDRVLNMNVKALPKELMEQSPMIEKQNIYSASPDDCSIRSRSLNAITPSNRLSSSAGNSVTPRDPLLGIFDPQIMAANSANGERMGGQEH